MKRAPVAEYIAQPALAIRAELAPATLDPDSRTVDVLFSTGAPVERTNFWTGERYVETLDVAPSAMRLDRLNAQAPLLDSHSAYDVGSQIGVVVAGSARIADGKAYARVRFSKRDAVEPIWRDVLDGIIANVSVGYRVHKYERTPADDETRTPEQRRAVDWEPYEISLVPMGADPGAKVRTEDRARIATTRCLVVTRGGKDSPTMQTSGTATVRASVAPAIVDPNPDGTAPEGYELREDGRCHRLPPPEKSDRELGIAEERARVNGIIHAATILGRRPSDPVVKKMLDDGTPLVEAQSALLDLHRVDRADSVGPRPGPSGAVVTRDARDSIRAGITKAFLHRIDSKAFPLDDHAKEYLAYSVVRCAEEVLEQQGIRTRHLPKSDVIDLALGKRVGYHTTSDFPLILADVANQTLRQRYDALAPTWGPIAQQVSIPDFKPVRFAAFGEAPALKLVLEHGEYTRGTIGEGKEQFQLATFGRIVAVTRQVLVNDDLGVFAGMAGYWARSARNLESDLIWGEFMKNANMADGFAVFSTQHANLVTPGTKLSVDALGVARAMLTKQTAMDGSTYLSLRPRYLIVPPGQETLAQQLTMAITAATSGAVNPFSGALQIISEPRLEGGIKPADGSATIAGDPLAWYMAASLDQIEMVKYGYLDGASGPVLDTRTGFDIDGIEYKCREDFAAKVIEYRGLLKNAGSATLLAAAADAVAHEADHEAAHNKGKGR